jgi:hypothetical protein
MRDLIVLVYGLSVAVVNAEIPWDVHANWSYAGISALGCNRSLLGVSVLAPVYYLRPHPPARVQVRMSGPV